MPELLNLWKGFQTVAQPGAIVLMFLMEPDVIKTDRYPITLVQEGLLGLEDLYRLDY